MPILTNNEKEFIKLALGQNTRIDGRRPLDIRPVAISFSSSQHGVCEVKMGLTHVLAVTTCHVAEPLPERPNEGFLTIAVGMSTAAVGAVTLSDAQMEATAEVQRMLDRLLRSSKALDAEALCISSGQKVWDIRTELQVMDNAGNLVQACSIALIGSLLHFRRPEVAVEGESFRILSAEEREPVPLSIHHIPVIVSYGLMEARSKFTTSTATATSSSSSTSTSTSTSRTGKGHSGGSDVAAIGHGGISRKRTADTEDISDDVEAQEQEGDQEAGAEALTLPLAEDAESGSMVRRADGASRMVLVVDPEQREEMVLGQGGIFIGANAFQEICLIYAAPSSSSLSPTTAAAQSQPQSQQRQQWQRQQETDLALIDRCCRLAAETHVPPILSALQQALEADKALRKQLKTRTWRNF